ncbi:MAG: 4Fe-4S dicluster domain-containing protein [Firmicutes bacterium]|nr:4Fe-4S dicluster domain-containing protein [Bacillota bacterium]
MHIYYFSGTGNTYTIASTIIETLRNHQTKAELIMINSQTELNNSKDTQSEPICLLFPINAHAMSPFIWRFIKNLPEGQGRDILVFYTYNSSAAIGEPIQKILNRKGYNLRVLKGLQMPNHLIIHEDEIIDNQKRYEIGMQITTKAIEAYLNGECLIDFKTDGSKILSFFNRHTSIIWNIMRLFTKLEVQKNKCMDCGHCKIQCPVSNIIYINGSYQHKNNCQFCMLCMSNCPNKAIRIKDNDKIKLVN